MSKTAVLPQVRVAPELRQSVEAALTHGETLSDFVESAVRRALDYRTLQTEFAARGQAASEHFARTGESFSTEEVLGELRQMTKRRRAELEDQPAR
jgi:Arc/MetJ-type ribon-helix-helix transcriptional regulator